MQLTWDIYEIKSETETLHGVKLRGRIRKFTLEQELACLTENAADEENTVRFAVLAGTDPRPIVEFIQKLLPESSITLILESIANPVLSKLKVNDVSRY